MDSPNPTAPLAALPQSPSLPQPDPAPDTPLVRRVEWIMALAAFIFISLLTLCITTYHNDSDQANIVLLGNLIFEEGTIFPQGWRFAAEVATMPGVSPTPVYGFLYWLSDNYFFTRHIGSLLMVYGVLAAMIYMLSPLGIRTPYILLGSALMFSRNTLHGDVFYYYPGLIIAILVVIGYWLRLLENKSGKFQRFLCVLIPVLAFVQGWSTPRFLVLYFPLATWAFLPVIKKLWRNPNFNPRLWFTPWRIWVEPMGWFAATALGVFTAKIWPLVNRNADVTNTVYKLNGIDDFWERMRQLPLVFFRFADCAYDSVGLITFESARTVFTLGLILFVLYLLKSVYGTSPSWSNALGANAAIAGLSVVLVLCTSFSGYGEKIMPRYLFWLFPLAAVIMALSLEWCRRHHRNHLMLSGVVLAILLLRLLPMNPWNFAKDVLRPPAKKKAEILRDYLDRHGLSRGYATYWTGLIHALAMNDPYRISALSNYFSPPAYNAHDFRYTAEYANTDVFLLLTEKQEGETLKNPDGARHLAQGKKITEIVPQLNLRVYTFNENPFVKADASLMQPGGRFLYSPSGRGFKIRGTHKVADKAIEFIPDGSKRHFEGPWASIPEGRYRLVVRYHYQAPPTNEQAGVTFVMKYFKVGKVFAKTILPFGRTEIEFNEVRIDPGVTAASFELLFPKDLDVAFRIEAFELTRLP